MADEIVPLLFLGNITDAINWRGALVPCLFEEGSLREEALEALLERIHKYRGDGVPVLVHCENGIDRSPTVVMHYLVRKLGMSQEDAIKLIKEKRPVANPHPEWEIKKSIVIVDDEFLKQQTHLGAWIIPEEDRIYLTEIKHPEKLPKQLPVYEGPRGGRFISRRDLQRLGVREEEIGVERKPREEEGKPPEEEKPRPKPETELEEELREVERQVDGFKKTVAAICRAQLLTSEEARKVHNYFRRAVYEAAELGKLRPARTFPYTIFRFVSRREASERGAGPLALGYYDHTDGKVAIVMSPLNFRFLFKESYGTAADIRKFEADILKKYEHVHLGDMEERKKLLKEIWELMGSVLWVLMHELGHYYFRTTSREAMERAYIRARRILTDFYEDPSCYLRDYSQSNIDEFFADHYALYKLMPNLYRRLYPRFYVWWEATGL